MIRIAHIINPVIVSEASDLHAAQPVTFETMRVAQGHAREQASIELYAAQFQEDITLVPSWITHASVLGRSVLDVGDFEKQRKLPFISDILDRLYALSDADYFIYTNVDIALMPYFYLAVAQLIETGVDAMVINRRTIAKTPADPVRLPLMWAQVGETHPGYDCFVFRREAYADFRLGKACIGANHIGKILLLNLAVNSKRLKIFKDLHLTFHLGDDRAWKKSEFSGYDHHNLNELKGIVVSFKEDNMLQDHPVVRKIVSFAEREKSKKGLLGRAKSYFRG